MRQVAMIMAPLLAGLMAATVPAVAPPPGVMTFSVHTTPLRLTLPAGYCAPAGAQESVAAMAAAADPLNDTLATVLKCGPPQEGFTDYFLIKVTKAQQALELSRPVMLAALGPAFRTLDSKAIMDQTKSAMKDSFGDSIALTEGSITPAGQDGVCGYLNGVLSVQAGDQAGKMTLTTCVTTVKRKIVAINHYRVGAPQGTQAERLAIVRRIADGMIADNEK